MGFQIQARTLIGYGQLVEYTITTEISGKHETSSF